MTAMRFVDTSVLLYAVSTAWLRFPVQETTVPLMRAALETKRRHRVSYWDDAIVEAARLLECETLLSEDLSHGRDHDGVRVANPFR